ncbi:MAG: LLM class flavin-dependent oxidoreductase, partial [Myxococcota bacterium]
RNPVLVAKQIMSLAVMSDNRFSFGVGLSPWPEDFAVTGVPWEGRGRRMDEMIEILRGLSTGDYYEFHGDHFDFQSIKMTPAPSEPIPILIGGHSDAAIRRAARVGDGWMHAGGTDEDLRKMIDRLKELRSEYDRSNEPFEIHVISMEGFTLAGLRRLEDGGVTDAVVGLRPGYEGDAMSLEEKLSAVHRFADEVISKL